MPTLSEDTDTYHLVLATSILIGISTLLPYNAFLSAPDFLQQYYDIVSGDGDSSSGEEALQYENWWKTMPTFSALLGVFPNLLVQLLLLLPCGQRIVMYTRFCTSILIMTACLVIVLLLCFVGGSSITEASALVILLLSITVCGAATGLIQATIFSFTAELPPVYTGTAMTGMALSGLITSILRIISKASNSDAPLVDAVIYFGFAVSILVLTLFCIWFFLKKNPYALNHTHILSGETSIRLKR
jgi:solute carrier family 29 (equilibrative nucleoside transporter), member 1/2/3